MFNNQPSTPHKRLLKASPVRLICLSFLLVIFTGAVLLTLPISSRSGVITPFPDALFTATSATCVTGLVVYDTYLYWSVFGQIIILLLIQIGGLGLVTLTTFFNMAIGRKMGLRSMDLAKESVNSDNFADARRMVKTAMVVTFAIEGLGALVLAFTFVPEYGAEGIYISIFTAVSAFCNAGFDLMGRHGAFVSLTGYADQAMVCLPIMLLIIFGGLGFVVWRELYQYRRTHTLSLHTRVVLFMTVLLIVLGGVVISILEWNNPPTMAELSPADKVMAGFFQSVTTRTAGFNTIDQAGMTDLSKIISIALMFIGAAPASTGGGIKVTTVAVMFMTVSSVMRGYEDTIIMGHKLDKKAVYKAMALLFLALTVVIFSSMLMHFALDNQVNSIDIVYEEVSAFATVGLSAGVTARLGMLSRMVLILSMYLGRVGPVSLAVSLAMRNSSAKQVLPQGKILIG